MIHHISIAANDPLRVAQVLAKLLSGKVIPFSSNPGSYVAFASDVHETSIEVHPLETALRSESGRDAAQQQTNLHPPTYSAAHVAISTLSATTAIDTSNSIQFAEQESVKPATTLSGNIDSYLHWPNILNLKTIPMDQTENLDLNKVKRAKRCPYWWMGAEKS